MNACRSVCGPTGLVIPPRIATRRTTPRGAVPVQPLPVRAEEDRPIHAFADGQVDRPGCAGCERDGDDLAALAGDDKRPVPALDAQVLDVRASCFGDPQPIERQHGDQRVLAR